MLYTAMRSRSNRQQQFVVSILQQEHVTEGRSAEVVTLDWRLAERWLQATSQMSRDHRATETGTTIEPLLDSFKTLSKSNTTFNRDNIQKEHFIFS